MSSVTASAPRMPFHVMVKPVGPICNLDCKYCFYLEKESLYPARENFRMAPEMLDSYICQYIAAQPEGEITFAWQGGEPTLLGVPFFENVVELQGKYGNGRPISNAFQTNGTLLDDRWGAFFKENGFLGGISIDGPRALHNAYRVDKKQRPSISTRMPPAQRDPRRCAYDCIVRSCRGIQYWNRQIMQGFDWNMNPAPGRVIFPRAPRVSSIECGVE